MALPFPYALQQFTVNQGENDKPDLCRSLALKPSQSGNYKPVEQDIRPFQRDHIHGVHTVNGERVLSFFALLGYHT